MATYKNKKITFDGAEYPLGDGIGSGGNGYVCSAKSAEDSVEYAVKFLTLKEGDNGYTEKSERFLQELRFCKDADHRNILKVLGHGEFNGQLCYIMPRCTKTLKTIIEEEHDFLKLLDYSTQLCEAVKYIHDRGIVHRDIKPENIFLDSNANLVLADFGIAHFVDSTLTKAGDWLGNKSYAAPEQLVKGNARDVTTSCDIYAVGAIINELFTKAKPSGSRFRTVSEVEPLLSPLDNLIDRCMRQNPEERPRIEEVLAEIKLIRGDLEQAVEFIMDGIFVDEQLSEDVVEKTLNKACKDILAAKHIFERVSGSELEKYDCNYHRDIHYNVSSHLKNLYFQKRVFDVCMRKFNYEAHVYAEGQQYTPLNLDNPHDFAFYKKFEGILSQYKVGNRTHDISGQILKIFSACCDYHCEEIIREIPRLEKFTSELDDAPILYIVYNLRQVLSSEDIREIDFIDHVEINWRTSVYDEAEDGSLYKAEEHDEEQILSLFEQKWDAICNKADAKHYSVKFKERAAYESFRHFALTLAKHYYAFEGDVLDVIRIKREYDGIVELEPWNSCDVTNVLAKILGLRTDY